MNLAAVLSVLGVISQHPVCELQNLSIDSRQIKPGDLFLAVPGEKVDGRDYIQQAVANGAVAVLAESPCNVQANIPIIIIPNLKDQVPHVAAAFYEYPARALKIIGITGTNGKTSCSHYIAQILNATRHKCGVMGTLGNGLLHDLHSTQLTTSDSCTVQHELANLRAAHAAYVALEVSSHALVQGRLQDTEFNTAVFTNLSQDHLDYHKDMQDYFAAKALLFSEYKIQHAVVNLDDAHAEQLMSHIPNDIKTITYSCNNSAADVYLEDNTIHTPWGIADFVTPLIGKFNKSNVLACIATCCLQDITLEVVLHAVKNLVAVPGRMQRVACKDPAMPQVVIDYAHTPDAIIKALQSLREHATGKLFCIVGCGGDRDRTKRPLMLQAALDNSDHVVITQDNPRTEDPQQIIADMLQHLHPANIPDTIAIELDRAAAIKKTVELASQHDLILIAGKGHEDYQIIGTQKLPFSDLLVAQQALITRSKTA